MKHDSNRSAYSVIPRVRRLTNKQNWRVWSFLVCGVLLALIMADTSFQRHPGLTALAGVLIGGVVTAASTWIIGPEVDRENRNASRRELATLTILESVVVDMGDMRESCVRRLK
jgi:hypothetical protein